MKTLYHISRKLLGNECEFLAQKPISIHSTEKELNNRVCAAQNLEQCWYSISGSTLFESMRKEVISGYFFFVYSFKNTQNFNENRIVNDFEKTNEYISFNNESATLISCFYVAKHKLLNKNFNEVFENATIEEAIECFNDQEYFQTLEKAEKMAYWYENDMISYDEFNAKRK